jgi:hypothetical protein
VLITFVTAVLSSIIIIYGVVKKRNTQPQPSTAEMQEQPAVYEEDNINMEENVAYGPVVY